MFEPDGPESDTTGSSDHIAELQSAAREMLGAARGLLDAVERVLDDDERVAALVGGFTDVLRFASEAVSKASTGEKTEPGAPGKDRVQHIVVS
jgi:hypothetical protein